MPDTISLNRPPRFGIRSLGYGSRAVIWTQGCTLACPGCVSLDTWSPTGGTVWAVTDLVDTLLSSPDGLDGLTISGGEPFQQPDGLGALVAALRRRAPVDFDILSYTGYRIEHLRNRHADILSHLDALVDGRYRDDLPTDRPFRGSRNQRLHRLSALGRRRYANADDPAIRPSLQVIVTGDGLEMAGIPGRGELDALERRLADNGLHLDGASWRA